MRVLHLYDSPATGGATVAAESVIACVAGSAIRHQDAPTTWQHAYRAVSGYCDRSVSRWLCGIINDGLTPWPEVIHLHNFRDWGTGLIHGAKKLGIRVVWSCYDYWALDPRCLLYTPYSWRTYQPAKGRRWPLLAKAPLWGRNWRIMRWLNRLDAVVCLSKHSADLLRAHGLTVPVHVVPLPITVPEERLYFKQDRNPNLVLYLGGEHPHKGAAVFREAIRIVQTQRPEVIGLTANGPSRQTALREIARAACLVVPEQWPNVAPVVCVEAQLLGTPVVASDIGGIPELHPRALCPPGRPGVFAKEIIGVLDDQGPDVVTMDLARGRHDPASVRAQLEEVYRC